VSAGNVKRDRIMKIKENMKIRGESNIDEASIAENLPEQEVREFYAIESHEKLNQVFMYQVALSADIAIFSFHFLSLHLYKITSRNYSSAYKSYCL
jgi:hypothetical protein